MKTPIEVYELVAQLKPAELTALGLIYQDAPTRAEIGKAIGEMAEYSRACSRLASTLNHLKPVPLDESVLEYGL